MYLMHIWCMVDALIDGIGCCMVDALVYGTGCLDRLFVQVWCMVDAFVYGTG